MASQSTRRAAACAAAAAIVVGGTLIRAGRPLAESQGVSRPDSVVVGSGNVLLIVEDVERSIPFYELLKVTIPPPAKPGPRPFSSGPALMNMVGLPGAQVRPLVTRVPGSNLAVELEDFKDIDRNPVRARPQDPGGVTVVLLVRDLNAAFAPLKQAGARVVTSGGEPISLGSKGRAVLMTDPDGHFVELWQPDPLPPTTAPAESNLIGAQLRFTIADTDKTMQVYRDVLQLPITVGPFGPNVMADLMGLKGAQVRLSAGEIPGSGVHLEFVEIKGVERTPIRPRTQDPGNVRLQVKVRNLESVMSQMKVRGSEVLSVGGIPVALGSTGLNVIMPDPDGVVLQFQQPPAPK